MKADHAPPPSPWVVDQARHWPDGALILDFAAGTGRHSRALMAMPDRAFKILAVDRDADALAALAAACPAVETHCQDLETDEVWRFADRQFTVVLVTNYLFRPKLAILFPLVAQGGFFVYETFAVGNAAFGRPRNPNFLLTAGELPAALPADFTQTEYFHGRIDRPNPAMIQRMAARRGGASLAPPQTI
jgi:hypothetical protein